MSEKTGCKIKEMPGKIRSIPGLVKYYFNMLNCKYCNRFFVWNV